MDTTTVIIVSAAAAIVFALILSGAVIEGRRNEERDKRHPYPFKRRTLSGVIGDDLRRINTGSEEHKTDSPLSPLTADDMARGYHEPGD